MSNYVPCEGVFVVIFFKKCIIRQLLDSDFVMPGIIKVEVKPRLMKKTRIQLLFPRAIKLDYNYGSCCFISVQLLGIPYWFST